MWNAEEFLPATLASLQSQTLADLEIVVSDNASTDGTAALVAEYAAADPRIRYVGSDQNLGAAWNFNRVVGLATGEYFKWAAADDLCEPTFMARCVAALDADPSAVLALPGVVEIDEDGAPIERWTHQLRVTAPDPATRFADLLNIGYACYHIFGVIRLDALKRTGLIGPFSESDMVTLAELALHGRFLDLDGDLFLHRQHPRRSVELFPDRYARTGWFDTARADRLAFPTWRFLLEYHRAIGRSPLSSRNRRRCRAALVGWSGRRWRELARDVRVASRQLQAKRRRPVSGTFP